MRLMRYFLLATLHLTKIAATRAEQWLLSARSLRCHALPSTRLGEFIEPEPEVIPVTAIAVPTVSVVLSSVPEPVPVEPITPKRAERAQLVVSLLDEAWGQGLKSYAELMGYVKEQTGTACSRRTIAQWKADRKRFEAA